MKTFFASLLAMVMALPLLSAAPQPRVLKTLSVHELMTLPATTKISLGKATITVGRLRANHNALIASRQRVKAVNVATLRQFERGNYSFTKTFGGTIRPGHFTPINLSTPPGGVPTASRSGFAGDYQQFCSSVPANVCLYYPPGITWYAQDGNGNYQTVDPLITDAGVCTQTGGQIGTLTNTLAAATISGCVYTYPNAQTVNFVPPAKGFTATGWCDAASGNFSSQIDPHGAVQIRDAGISGFASETYLNGTFIWGTTPNLEQFCFLKVKPN